MPESLANSLVKFLRRHDVQLILDVQGYGLPRAHPEMLELADLIDEAPIYVADFGVYRQPDPATDKALEQDSDFKIKPSRWAMDGARVAETAAELSRMGLLRLPYPVVFIEDYYETNPDNRVFILANEVLDDDGAFAGIAYHVWQRVRDPHGRVMLYWAPIMGIFTPDRLDGMIDIHPIVLESPMLEILRPMILKASPSAMHAYASPGFTVRKLIVMLASRGIVVERQKRQGGTGSRRRPNRQSHFHVVRLPGEYEVTRTGEAAEAPADSDRLKQRRSAHWVRGHIRGRNCWPEEKWVWIPPHFRGVGKPARRRPTIIKEKVDA